MPRLLITTIIRRASLDEPSGYVHAVDAERMAPLGRAAIIEPEGRERDTNPRGGLRGGRGIAFSPDGFAFIANNNAVHRFDSQWRRRGVFESPLCASIHDISHQGGRLYVTASFTDLLFVFESDGRLADHVNVREHANRLPGLNWRRRNLLSRQAVLAGKPDLRIPGPFDINVYDGLHLNSLCFLPNGDMLLSLGLLSRNSMKWAMNVKDALVRAGVWPLIVSVNQFLLRVLPLPRPRNTELAVASPLSSSSAVIRLDTSGRESRLVKVFPKARHAMHSLLAPADGGALVAETGVGDLVEFDPESGAEIARLHVSEEYLRGLTRLDDGTIVAGSQRDLLFIDWKKKSVVHSLRLSDDARESIYDVKPLPPEFAPLPPHLDGGEPSA